MKTQTAQILNYLRRGNSLTPLEALKCFGSLRLGARIFELKEAGHKIHSVLIERNGKHIACYSLAAK